MLKNVRFKAKSKPTISLYSLILLSSIVLLGIILSISPISAWNSNLNTNLVGYWNFQEGAGNTTADATGQQPAGTIEGTDYTWIAGKLGTGGIAFNGISHTDMFVPLTTYFTQTTPVSFSYWISAPTGSLTGGGFGNIVGVSQEINSWTGDWNGYNVYPQDSGGAEFKTVLVQGGYNTKNVWTTESIVRDNWTHYVVIYDGTVGGISDYNYKVYRNGIDISPPSASWLQTGTGTPSYNLNTFIIGGFHGSAVPSNNYLIGNISEVGLWNRALTPTEVAQLYNGGAGLPFVASLVLNSPLDEGISLNPIIFNCSVPTASSPINISLYTNSTGIWKINQTITSPPSINNQSYGIFNLNLTNPTLWSCRFCDSLTCTYAGSNYTVNPSTYKINSETYNAITYAGANENFNLNFSTLDNINSVYLIYNGTHYIASVTNIGNTYIATRSLTIPAVPTGTIYNFYWNVNLDSETFNTTIHNQTLSNIALDNCSTYSITLYNFSIHDQDTLALINSSFNININIAPYGTTNYFLNFSHSYNNDTSSKRICVSSNLNNSIYSISITADYQGIGYVKQFYYLDKGTLTNQTNPQINLWDLTLTPAPTTFLITFSDPAGNPVPNGIVNMYRFYIGEGLYREVEKGKLNSQSQTHLHMTEEDVIYYFTVTLANQLIYTSPTYQAMCISTPCSVTLSASTPYLPFNAIWDSYDGTSIASYVNKTLRTAYVSFVSNNVHTINVSLYTINNGNNLLINSSKLTSTAGTISLYVPYPYGNQTFYMDISQDGQFIKTIPVDMGLSGKDLFGSFGIFLVILLIASLILIASTDGVLVIVFTIVGLIISVFLLLLDMSWLTITSIVIIGGLIIWKISSRKR